MGIRWRRSWGEFSVGVFLGERGRVVLGGGGVDFEILGY